MSGQTPDIPAVRWVESQHEPGKCLSHTQALNLTYVNWSAAISQGELHPGVRARRLIALTLNGCQVMMYQCHLKVLMSEFSSFILEAANAVANQQENKYIYCIRGVIASNINPTPFTPSLLCDSEVMSALHNSKPAWVTWIHNSCEHTCVKSPEFGHTHHELRCVPCYISLNRQQ